MIAFLDKREQYEDRIISLQESSAAKIHMASWKVSVKKALQKTLFILGKFASIAPGVAFKDLTSAHIQEAILEIAEGVRSQTFDVKNLDTAMSKLRTDMSISDPKARMVMLVADFN